MNPTIKKVIQQFKKVKLTSEERIEIMNAMLEKLAVPPISDIITLEKGEIKVKDHALDVQQLTDFKLSLMALQDNPARKILFEQIKYEAVKMGVHRSVSVDELLFSKAALWILNQEEELLTKFSTSIST